MSIFNPVQAQVSRAVARGRRRSRRGRKGSTTPIVVTMPHKAIPRGECEGGHRCGTNKDGTPICCEGPGPGGGTRGYLTLNPGGSVSSIPGLPVRARYPTRTRADLALPTQPQVPTRQKVCPPGAEKWNVTGGTPFCVLDLGVQVCDDASGEWECYPPPGGPAPMPPHLRAGNYGLPPHLVQNPPAPWPQGHRTRNPPAPWPSGNPTMSYGRCGNPGCMACANPDADSDSNEHRGPTPLEVSAAMSAGLGAGLGAAMINPQGSPLVHLEAGGGAVPLDGFESGQTAWPARSGGIPPNCSFSGHNVPPGSCPPNTVSTDFSGGLPGEYPYCCPMHMASGGTAHGGPGLERDPPPYLPPGCTQSPNWQCPPNMMPGYNVAGMYCCPMDMRGVRTPTHAPVQPQRAVVPQAPSAQTQPMRAVMGGGRVPGVTKRQRKAVRRTLR